MAPENPRVVYVEGRGLEPLGDPGDLARWHEQEDGFRINETADEPGAGDAVDLGPGPRDPDGSALLVSVGDLAGLHHGQFGGRPVRDAALEGLGLDAGAAQPGRGAVAVLAPVLADHHDGPAAQRRRPFGDPVRCARQRAGHEALIADEFL